MTTPAQYEAAIRFLEKLAARYKVLHAQKWPEGGHLPDIESALAIVREARERDVNARGAEAAQSLYDRAFNRTEVPDAR